MEIVVLIFVVVVDASIIYVYNLRNVKIMRSRSLPLLTLKRCQAVNRVKNVTMRGSGMDVAAFIFY
jgi:hypothetical protein